jgi:hypothetical protein
MRARRKLAAAVESASVFLSAMRFKAKGLMSIRPEQFAAVISAATVLIGISAIDGNVMELPTNDSHVHWSMDSVVPVEARIESGWRGARVKLATPVTGDTATTSVGASQDSPHRPLKVPLGNGRAEVIAKVEVNGSEIWVGENGGALPVCTSNVVGSPIDCETGSS